MKWRQPSNSQKSMMAMEMIDDGMDSEITARWEWLHTWRGSVVKNSQPMLWICNDWEKISIGEYIQNLWEVQNNVSVSSCVKNRGHSIWRRFISDLAHRPPPLSLQNAWWWWRWKYQINEVVEMGMGMGTGMEGDEDDKCWTSSDEA